MARIYPVALTPPVRRGPSRRFGTAPTSQSQVSGRGAADVRDGLSPTPQAAGGEAADGADTLGDRRRREHRGAFAGQGPRPGRDGRLVLAGGRDQRLPRSRPTPPRGGRRTDGGHSPFAARPGELMAALPV
ncbi:hypothetical protein AB0O03_18890 [Streptomyces diastaticus]|uniref:hypothetical protein n=1 Tax=Streptomyces diastaticus TaxID=1956 RepID=UPI0034354928